MVVYRASPARRGRGSAPLAADVSVLPDVLLSDGPELVIVVFSV